MTNLRNQEGKRNEKELVVKRTEDRAVCHSTRRGAWSCGDEPVEFVDAASVRLASDQRLVEGGPLAAEQDTLRRISWWTGQAHVLALPHEGALGAHDPGGAREVPRRYARSLRFIWTARCGPEVLSRTLSLSRASATFCIAFRFLFAYNKWLLAGKTRSPGPVSGESNHAYCDCQRLG